jgi:hypothetical protein
VKSVFIALVALAAAALLTACGDGGAADTSSSSTPGPSSLSKLPSSQANDASSRSSRPEGAEESIEGFGSEASGSVREAITTAFHDYLGALTSRDYRAACRDLSAGVRRSLRHGFPHAGSCPAALSRLLAPTAPGVARAQAGGRLTQVRVQGSRAFVVFQAPGAKLYQMPMQRLAGDWKVGFVSASILVPAATLGQ